MKLLNTTDDTGQSDFDRRAVRIRDGEFSVNGKDDDIRQAVGAYFRRSVRPMPSYSTTSPTSRNS